ncbi:hypothetical protein Q1695_007587 [Nippostrongylus brasiliensis]|nr:hypothetical protein Q1695_007587 [Nippostrongylus brasiliensis]
MKLAVFAGLLAVTMAQCPGCAPTFLPPPPCFSPPCLQPSLPPQVFVVNAPPPAPLPLPCMGVGCAPAPLPPPSPCVGMACAPPPPPPQVIFAPAPPAPCLAPPCAPALPIMQPPCIGCGIAPPPPPPMFFVSSPCCSITDFSCCGRIFRKRQVDETTEKPTEPELENAEEKNE